MDALELLAEQRIAEALARGELDGLPGAGEPLVLEDLSRVPEDLRAGYLLLRGAGLLPEEMALKQEVLKLADLIRACWDEGERARLVRAHSAASLRYAILLERRGFTPAHLEYGEAIESRLARAHR